MRPSTFTKRNNSGIYNVLVILKYTKYEISSVLILTLYSFKGNLVWMFGFWKGWDREGEIETVTISSDSFCIAGQ